MKKQDKSGISSGVEQLIERLKNEGIAAGQERAEKIVLDAQKRAEWIIKEAELEAERLLKESCQQADEFRQAGEDALKLAARDTVIKLRDTLLNSFDQEVARIINTKMTDMDLLEQLILSLAATVRDKTAMDGSPAVLIRLPENVTGIDELKQNPEELQHGALSSLASAIASGMLRKGVRFEVDSELQGGIFIRLENEKIEIDFSDQAVADILLAHLQPRFRALLQGIVK